MNASTNATSVGGVRLAARGQVVIKMVAAPEAGGGSSGSGTAESAPGSPSSASQTTPPPAPAAVAPAPAPAPAPAKTINLYAMDSCFFR